MQELLALVLAAVAVVVAVELLADRTGLPTATLLTLGGLVYALLPGPDIQVPPDVILTVVLPPLLYAAALNASLQAIRHNLRSIVSLSVILVLVTALAVGTSFWLVVPGATLATGVALGAAVAPPDPVAALAVGRRAGLPRRLITLIEGEGLLNDATALTTLTVAVAALTSGGFSPGFAVLRFVLAAAGGAVAGAAVAAVVHLLRRHVHDPLLVTTLSLATPFAAYLLGELMHASAVLAVVITGLIVGHETPRAVSGTSRLQTRAVWRLIDFLLESFVFLLIGQQLPLVVRGLQPYSIATLAAAAAVTLATVLIVRPVWLLGTQWLPRRLGLRLGTSPDDRPGHAARLSGRDVLALSWAGTRGVVTIASMLTLPLVVHGRPFTERNLLLFCAYLVVIATLVGQGVSFAPVVHALRLRRDPDPAGLHARARAGAARTALARLDEIAERYDLEPAALDSVRRELERRSDGVPRVRAGAVALADRVTQARRQVIEVQRLELVRWRRLGRLPDDGLRALQRELDHEEGSLSFGEGE